MLVTAAAVFGLGAVGVLLVVRGLVGTTTPLVAVVAELHRPRTATPPPRRAVLMETLAGRSSPSRTPILPSVSVTSPAG